MREFFEIVSILVGLIIFVLFLGIFGTLSYAKYAYDFPVQVIVDNKVVFEGPSYLVWESYPSVTIKEKAYSLKSISEYRSQNIKILPLNK